MKYEMKSEMKKESKEHMAKPNAKMNMSEHPKGLLNVTLQGSGRSAYPALKKMTYCG